MKIPLWSTLERAIVNAVYNRVTTFVLVSLLASLGLAQTKGLPQGWESYLDRPQILSLKAEALKTSNPSWEKLKAAHFSFIAFLLEAYPPDTKFYFLARDSEHLYDVAMLATQGTKDSQRFHLLNVSRANMRDGNLIPYLNQNGISAEGLRKGDKVVFIDTGFAGTIPRVIDEALPQDIAGKLKTHLLVSSNPEHPSSRSFLIHLNPVVNDINPSAMHGTIVSYEHMPRYTDRSRSYQLVDGIYHPISPIQGAASDGVVNKEKSEAFMKDLISSWNNPQTRAQFNFEREQARWLHQALQNGSEEIKLQIIERLKSDNKASVGLFEAQLRDFFETEKNLPMKFKITLDGLGIHNGPVNNQNSKKNELIKKYPEWAPLLENPDDKIPELFAKGDWQMIGNLLDAKIDLEIGTILLTHLYDAPATGLKRDLQVLTIENADTATFRELLHIFTWPKTKNMTALLKVIIEKAGPSELVGLANHVFSQPHTENMTDLLKMVIEKADSTTLAGLGMFTFSEPHTKDMTDLLKMVIEKAGPVALQYLATYTFSKPHTKGMGDLLKMVIEKADSATMQKLVEVTFTKDHSMDKIDLLKMIVEKADPSTSLSLLNVFTNRTHFQNPKYDVLREALKIFKDPVKRKKFLDENYVNQDYLKGQSTINSKFKKFSFDVIQKKMISANLQADDVVQIREKNYKVIKPIGSGRRGIVYQIQGENGAYYALKVATDSSPDTLKSISNESLKTKEWQALKIPHSKILAQGDTYVLKTFIPGITGEEVLNRYKAGEVQYKTAVDQLKLLVEKIQARGAYVGDFRPPNLMWTGNAWVIIDSGSIDKDLTEEKVLSKWNSADERGPKFKRRWGFEPPQSPELCSKLFE